MPPSTYFEVLQEDLRNAHQKTPSENQMDDNEAQFWEIDR